ncbi:DUF3592 domain-containing protein [Pseudomonas sp. TH15]|uniref:DUF3592 domain-containing protein n=1 Tax=Pseudomonas sp. TH15 TaxID=2796381 RepID=UPI0019114808|nr:DUF3592 domain-containing protein [Pseudomonas sp. TH15]MBK5510411.1 DUF3592 domain-containing protein [Pseudomonas sp. TH15]
MKYIGGFIFGLMLLFSTVGAVYQGYDWFDLRIRGLKAPAQVLSTSSSRMTHVGSGNSYTTTRRVAFVTADGTPVIHEFTDEFSGAVAGDKVSVFYNPANPREVIAGTFFGLGLFLASIIFALLCVLGIKIAWEE